jgi:hypothetical protein
VSLRPPPVAPQTTGQAPPCRCIGVPVTEEPAAEAGKHARFTYSDPDIHHAPRVMAHVVGLTAEVSVNGTLAS